MLAIFLRGGITLRMARRLGDEGLTAKQRACYEMRMRGASWAEIAAALEISAQTARVHAGIAETKGMERLPRQHPGRTTQVMAADPEAAGKFAERAAGTEMIEADGTLNMKVFVEVVGAAGVPPKIAMELGRRIRANLGQVSAEWKKMSVAEEIGILTEKRQLLLQNIDQVSVVGMGAKDLALAYGILLDKSQLLGGKPTQIFDFNSRKQLAELMPVMIAEAKRRGITVDGTATVVQEKVLQEEAGA